MQAVIVEMREVERRELHGSGPAAQFQSRIRFGRCSRAKVLPQSHQVGAGELEESGFHGMDRVLAAVCAAADPARGWRTRERAGKGGVF
jgi:hypothetical protein